MAMLMLCTALAVTCRGCGVWRRTRIQLQRLYIMPGPVYSWLSCSVTSNMYQFDEHCMWIGSMSRGDKPVHLLLPPVSMPFCARGLAHCCLRYLCLFIASAVAELCDVFRWTF